MVRKDRSDGGFTLIELLVVTLVLPLVIGAVAVALVFGVLNPEQRCTNPDFRLGRRPGRVVELRERRPEPSSMADGPNATCDERAAESAHRWAGSLRDKCRNAQSDLL